MTQKNKQLIRILSILPLVIGILQALFGFFDGEYLRILFIGVVVVLIGGTMLGYIAYRWLALSTGSWDTLISLVAVSAFGLLTMGIVYYFLIPDPITTLTNPQRVSVQVIIFMQFLAAIGLGTTLVPSLIAT